jgi:hypothetical protein
LGSAAIGVGAYGISIVAPSPPPKRERARRRLPATRYGCDRPRWFRSFRPATERRRRRGWYLAPGTKQATSAPGVSASRCREKATPASWQVQTRGSEGTALAASPTVPARDNGARRVRSPPRSRSRGSADGLALGSRLVTRRRSPRASGTGEARGITNLPRRHVPTGDRFGRRREGTESKPPRSLQGRTPRVPGPL